MHDQGWLHRQRYPYTKRNEQILAKVIQYCKKHIEAANPEDKPSEDDLKTWDTDFVKVSQATLFDLILVYSLFDSALLLMLLIAPAFSFPRFY